MEMSKRDLHLLYLKSNIQRLSDETLERIIYEIEEEVEKAIDKEIEGDK